MDIYSLKVCWPSYHITILHVLLCEIRLWSFVCKYVQCCVRQCWPSPTSIVLWPDFPESFASNLVFELSKVTHGKRGGPWYQRYSATVDMFHPPTTEKSSKHDIYIHGKTVICAFRVKTGAVQRTLHQILSHRTQKHFQTEAENVPCWKISIFAVPMIYSWSWFPIFD